MKLYLISFVVAGVLAVTYGKDDTLQLVHVFFRHGARTPELKHVYPTDPFTAETFWPMGYGGLTNHGKQMCLKLGQVLRERYESFLGDMYYPEIVEPVSTDFDRTKVTLLLVLAGLFPPSPAQTWNETMPWLPIPIHYDKDQYDYTLRRPTWYCPAYNKELEQVLFCDDVQAELKAYNKVFKYIEEHTQLPIKTLSDVFGVYQTLNAEEVMNLTLPEWAQSVYPEKIHEIAAKQCSYENYSPLLKKLNGGRMLGKIIEHMVDKSDNKLLPPDRKIYLYSGHENNVINILAALNLFDPHVPKYTAAVMVELHYLKETSSYGVKVLYLEDANGEPEELKLEGCDTLCPLNNFIRITEPHVPVNYTADCHSHVNLD